MSWSVRRTAITLGFGAFAFYLFRIEVPPTFYYDEVYHAVTAIQLAKDNPDAFSVHARPPDGVGAYEWVHPALAKLPMQLGVRIFGANSFGWRISTVVFGALGIVLLYLLATTVFGPKIGLYSTILMLFDGLWFVQSRIAMNDVYIVSFLLFAYRYFYLYLRDRTRRALIMSGVGLGLAVATKWSAFYSLGLCGLIATIIEFRAAWRSPRALAVAFGLLFVTFIALPFILYVAGYAQFFSLGYSLDDLWELQKQMWWYHTHLKEGHAWASRWWTWPLLIRPLWGYVNQSGDRIAHIFALGNPAIFWAFLPSIAIVASAFVRSEKKWDPALGIVLLGFLGQWLPWALSPRISFIYHMLPCVPFGCMAIAWVVTRAQQKWVPTVYLALVVATFGYFYPHYAAVEISKRYSRQHYWLPSWDPYRGTK